MLEKVDLVFNYKSRWVLKPHVIYIKNLNHVLQGYDVDMLSYIDICAEYTEVLRYYVVEGDEGIRKLIYVLSTKFNVVQLFAIHEGEEQVIAPNIIQYNEQNIGTVEVGTDCDSSDEEGSSETDSSDYDREQLEVFWKEMTKEVTNKLEKYKEIEKGMSFKSLAEAKRVAGFYAVATSKSLKVKKSDTTRVRYKYDIGYPFGFHISKDRKDQGFKINTLNLEHNCDPTYKNRRATSNILAHYFKDKVKNNPKYKLEDMRVDLEDQFKLNVSYSTMKRVKRLVLEKLEGSHIDDYNRLEAYAQELRDSNPGFDAVINISKDALEQGKRKFLRMYICFYTLKNGRKGGLRPLIGLDDTFLNGKCKGILLVAMAQDSVNHIHPLAWAVVDKETEGEGVTFMFDMQKDLLDVSTVLPSANHRWCVRHTEANWSKK
ncbi:uncharacterized protein [Nicotiana sylvestris]|uniref:uncharacterized protein n=1 Tax=Nicotiana sylvestris TaxID=4096 RepID=UPI00388C358B